MGTVRKKWNENDEEEVVRREKNGEFQNKREGKGNSKGEGKSAGDISGGKVARVSAEF